MFPSLFLAETYLKDAGQRNPGPWVAHSRYVAQAMSSLAQALVHKRPGDPCFAGLDPERAWILGLLHDIGRREGVYGMRHVIDGYTFLASEGFPQAGRICLTHSYPDEGLIAGASEWDGTAEELDFVRGYIGGIEYDIYDRLAQLADSVCMPQGFVLMEKRMVDVALRYGIGSNVPIDRLARRWKAFFTIQKQIEEAIEASIYSYLPGVVENTFGV
jgi:hypothetical protein